MVKKEIVLSLLVFSSPLLLCGSEDESSRASQQVEEKIQETKRVEQGVQDRAQLKKRVEDAVQRQALERKIQEQKIQQDRAEWNHAAERQAELKAEDERIRRQQEDNRRYNH